MALGAETHFLKDPKFWMSFISLLVAVVAAFNSWRSRKIATRALSLNEAQERRRKPELTVYLADGYRRRFPTKRLFCFLVSVSNRSDTNNSIAKAELQVAYLIRDGVKTACRVPHNAALAEITAAPEHKPNILSLPTRVDAHQTAVGWLFFALENDLIGENVIDTHKILLEDSHGIIAEAEPISVKEWADENQS